MSDIRHSLQIGKVNTPNPHNCFSDLGTGSPNKNSHCAAVTTYFRSTFMGSPISAAYYFHLHGHIFLRLDWNDFICFWVLNLAFHCSFLT